MRAVKFLPPTMSVEETDKPLARSALISGPVRGTFSAANAALPAVAMTASRMRAHRDNLSFTFPGTSTSECRVKTGRNAIMAPSYSRLNHESKRTRKLAASECSSGAAHSRLAQRYGTAELSVLGLGAGRRL